MSQNDLVIANQTFPNTRADINSALQAIASLNSGATAPTTTYANMMWYDTTSGILKMRSEADDAWINLGELDQVLGTFTPSGVIGTSSDPNFSVDPTLLATRGTIKDFVKVVQVASFQTGASSSTSNIIPDDNTIPQNTEGAEFLSLAFSPTSATNILQIDVNLVGSMNNNRNLVVALFQDSAAGALAAAASFQASSNDIMTVPLRHRMVAGTTSSTTFKVRAGAGAATATLTVNGKFGGVSASSITITEIAV